MKFSALSGRVVPALLGAVLLLISAGCTSRGVTVTSQPPGAEVSVNRRVVGNTPIRVGISHYGTYRIELRKEKFTTLVKEEPIRPPIYGYDPAAFVADNIVPARLNDEVYLHYVLSPLDDKTDRAALMDRAEAARPQPSEAGPHLAKVTHPTSGEDIQVAIRADAPKRSGAKKRGDAEQLAIKEVSAVPAPPPPELGAVQDIKTVEPTDPTLRKELGLDQDDKRGEFIRPDAAKKQPAPRLLRTPKDEELLYDKPDAKAVEPKK